MVFTSIPWRRKKTYGEKGKIIVIEGVSSLNPFPGMSQNPLGRANEIRTTGLLSSESDDDGRGVVQGVNARAILRPNNFDHPFVLYFGLIAEVAGVELWCQDEAGPFSSLSTLPHKRYR